MFYFTCNHGLSAVQQVKKQRTVNIHCKEIIGRISLKWILFIATQYAYWLKGQCVEKFLFLSDKSK